MDPTDYDFTVFRITTEISRQVFPLMLDLDDPRFRAGLERLRQLATTAAESGPGLGGWIRRMSCNLASVVTFARLYLLPAKASDLPADIRLHPAW
jgi:magnesium-protoporphyrin IX monomethyl ester (oxidative) cyclase